VDTLRNPSSPGNRPIPFHAASSDASVLLEYRRGNFRYTLSPQFRLDNRPEHAGFAFIQAMALWQSKDYWGAMMEGTKGYALVQAGARERLVNLTVQSEIFPGISAPHYLQAPW
jgi:hypothetical protein